MLPCYNNIIIHRSSKKNALNGTRWKISKIHKQHQKNLRITEFTENSKIHDPEESSFQRIDHISISIKDSRF